VVKRKGRMEEMGGVGSFTQRDKGRVKTNQKPQITLCFWGWEKKQGKETKGEKWEPGKMFGKEKKRRARPQRGREKKPEKQGTHGGGNFREKVQ